jgi:hypothetical protein
VEVVAFFVVIFSKIKLSIYLVLRGLYDSTSTV